jgi:membrane associated rhomboid family serine protease
MEYSLLRKLNPYQIINESRNAVALEEAQPKPSSQNRFAAKVNSLTTPLVILVSVLAALWLVELADMLLPRLPFVGIESLDNYGILPRETDEIWRIAAAPFLHADYRHLIANSIPLLVLGYLVIIRNKWHFPLVFVCAVLVSGLGVWLFGGANSIHIGASGVVFGFMGYLLGRGFFERSIVSILFGLVALLLYGSILVGVLPGQEGVSWLGHLFGLAGGALVAYIFSLNKRRSQAEAQQNSA